MSKLCLFKVQRQVEVTFSKDLDKLGYTHGAAICPFCNVATPIRFHAEKYAYADNKCPHSCGAVDAGKARIAVHFETKVSENPELQLEKFEKGKPV